MTTPAMLAAGFLLTLFGAAIGAAVMLPRWTLQAFQDTAKKLRARTQEVPESLENYLTSRGLALLSQGETLKLSGHRMTLPSEDSGPALEVDLLYRRTRGQDGRRRSRRTDSTDLVFYIPFATGQLFRLQRCSAMLRPYLEMLMKTVLRDRPEDFEFGLGLPIDTDHMIATIDADAAREFLDEATSRAFSQATEALEPHGGACILLHPRGLTLVFSDPGSARVSVAGLNELLGPARALAAQVIARVEALDG